jgi:mRNA-degrading endonuclease toxin of MazEF toxin-antitoxin module
MHILIVPPTVEAAVWARQLEASMLSAHICALATTAPETSALPAWCASTRNTRFEQSREALETSFGTALIFDFEGASYVSWYASGTPTRARGVTSAATVHALLILTLPSDSRAAVEAVADQEVFASLGAGSRPQSVVWAADYESLGDVVAAINAGARLSRCWDAVGPSPVVSPVLLSPNVRRMDTVARVNELRVVPSSGPEDLGRTGDIVVGFVTSAKAYDLWFHGCEKKVRFVAGSAVLVAAPLGSRESSTHPNGGIPDAGIVVSKSETLDWLAAGGLVGLLEGDADSCANPLAQRSHLFEPVGFLTDSAGERFCVSRLSLRPKSSALVTKVLLVAGTSAEAGKSTLAAKIIESLTASGLRVATVKATGTGGFQDSRHHRSAGAIVTYDQVDAGLPTTYVSAEAYLATAMTPFLLCQDANPDVIVAEMGGDIIWANNDTLLRVSPIVEAMAAVFLIANDSLAALGAMTWLRDVVPASTLARVLPVCCPFRNHCGAVRRAEALGMKRPIDPNNVEEIKAAALQALA